MKKVKLTALAVSLSLIAVSQPYFEADYSRVSGYYASDALYATVDMTGFVMASTNTSPPAHFVLDKTTPGGTFGAGSWSKEFTLRWRGATNTFANFTDVPAGFLDFSIAEGDYINNNVNPHFAAVTANFDGLFFCRIDLNNTYNNASYYPFPVTANAISKPVIARGFDPNGDLIYFITGSFRDPGTGTTHMYLVEVSQTGALLNLANYDIGSGNEIIPTSIVVSPFNNYYNREVVIAGKLDNNNGRDLQGFVMFVDATSTPFPANVFYHFDESVATATDENFESIAISNSGTQGYILGGYASNPGNVKGTAWLMKIDQTGAIVWDNKYESSTIGHPEIVSVIERTSGGNTSFFGLAGHQARGNNGTEVIRVDASGSWYSGGSPIYNDYVFNYTSGGVKGRAIKLSYMDNGTNDVGLHTYNEYQNGDTHLISSYFNGEAGGCAPLNNQTNIYSTSIQRYNTISPTVSGGLTVDWPAQTENKAFSTSQNITCGGSNSYPGGSNARLTGISEIVGDEFSIYPNPVKNILNLSLNKSHLDETQITLTSALGSCVYRNSLNTEAVSNPVSIDFNSLGLSEGVYFLKIENKNEETKTYKVLYQH